MLKRLRNIWLGNPTREADMHIIEFKTKRHLVKETTRENAQPPQHVQKIKTKPLPCNAWPFLMSERLPPSSPCHTASCPNIVENACGGTSGGVSYIWQITYSRSIKEVFKHRHADVHECGKEYDIDSSHDVVMHFKP